MDIKLFIKDNALGAVTKGHPWVFEGAIAKINGAPMSGDLVRVLDRQSNFLGWAWYSVESRIKARMISFRAADDVDETWLPNKLETALTRRKRLMDDDNLTALRLVNAEADGLPGLVVDLYAETAVLQALSSGAEARKKEVAQWLMDRLELTGVYERSDGETRRLEGLSTARGLLLGQMPEEQVEVSIDGCLHKVDVVSGDGTGAYLDQRDPRATVARLAQGARVLDLYCHSGGFALSALKAGAASAVLVDSSARALKEARVNSRLNGVHISARRGADMVQGNGTAVLRQYREAGRIFDVVALDPPPLTINRSKAAKALKDHGDLHFQALKLLQPGGLLAAFCRTPGIEPADLEESVLRAARDLGYNLQIVSRTGPSEDFPSLAGFAEAGHPTGLICRPI